VIDGDDTIFSQLKVWRDTDQDGIADAGELTSLSALGIASINLGYTDSSSQAAGNEIRQVGSFTFAGGGTSTIVDAWFAVDHADTIYDLNPSLPGDLQFFPDLHGYGELPQLVGALSQLHAKD
jgi:hypothetical protein